MDVGEYVIVRTLSAGLFAGTITWRDGQEIELTQARRLWFWKGAATLSQLAEEGTTLPQDCRFPVEVRRVLLTQAIEVLAVSENARKSIASVPVWSA